MAGKNNSRRRRARCNVYLLSDATGNLLEHFFNAVQTQFPEKTFRVHSVPFVNTEDRAVEVIDDITSGIVCHALADPSLKAAVTLACARRRMRCCDVTGPTVQFLEAAGGVQAASRPKPVHTVDASYMGRMSALEFAMQHDDNRRLERLAEAEIVLVGISRVSKSPNALFMAYRGFRVANVAIVPSEGLPRPLARHRRRNVVALTIQPKRLAEIRDKRFEGWRLDGMDYADLTSVIHEVRDAETIYRRRRWPIIDTTDRTVEETSARTLRALRLRPKDFS